MPSTHPIVSRLLIPAALLLVFGLPALAGCGGTSGETTGDTSGAATGETIAQLVTTAATTDGQAATSTAQTTTTPSDPGTVPGSSPDSGTTPGSAPDSGTTLTSSDGLPAGITPEEIRAAMGSIGMGSPDRLQIYDHQTFGHYAAAYVMAADENVYLVLFNDETGGWAILAAYTGQGWDAVQADLRAKAAPENLIEWANPGEGA